MIMNTAAALFVLIFPLYFRRCLNDELVWDGGDELWNVVLCRDVVGGTWLPGLALDVGQGDAGLLGFLLLFVVALDAVQEVNTASGVLDVLDADVDSLGENPSANAFVDDDAHSVLADVEHTSGLAVVSLVWHTFLESTVTLEKESLIPCSMAVSSLQTLMSTMSPIL